MYVATTFCGDEKAQNTEQSRLCGEGRAYLSFKWFLSDCRVPLRDEHKCPEYDHPDGEQWEQGLDIRQITERQSARNVRRAEPQRDEPDARPDEERRDTGDVEQPGEHDTFSPDGGQESQAGESQCEPIDVRKSISKSSEQRDVENPQESWNRHSAPIDPPEHSRSVAVTGEREQHARRRIETRVRGR